MFFISLNRVIISWCLGVWCGAKQRTNHTARIKFNKIISTCSISHENTTFYDSFCIFYNWKNTNYKSNLNVHCINIYIFSHKNGLSTVVFFSFEFTIVHNVFHNAVGKWTQKNHAYITPKGRHACLPWYGTKDVNRKT